MENVYYVAEQVTSKGLVIDNHGAESTVNIGTSKRFRWQK